MIDLGTILNPGFSSNDNSDYVTSKFDYYSGSQITVWFGDILVDDISAIQWSRSQNKKPIYGYASQQFDSVAKGTVIIQGSFVTNFRQSGYLSMVMDRIKSIYGNNANPQFWPEIKRVIGQHLKNGTFGPVTAQEIQDLGNSSDFLTLCKAYEDTIWGGGIPGDDGQPQTVRYGPADVQQHNDLPDGFTVLITYGNTYGNEARTLNDYMQSTTKSLVGVHLVGESQSIQVGGQPVLEQYDFIARGTDEYVGTER